MLRKRLIAALIIFICIFLTVSCGKAQGNGSYMFELTDVGGSLKSQLAATLSELKAQGVFDEHFMDGYAMALFDLNYDGVPELIEAEAGGSSGGVNYIAYDMAEGDVVATFSGGVFKGEHSDAWCVYFDTKTNNFKTIENFTVQSGSTTLNRHISELVFDADLNAYTEKCLFCIEYDIEDDSVDGKVTANYFYCDDSVSVTEYNYEYDIFTASCVRIPETGMKLIRWADVEDENDPNISVNNMIDALLSSGQKFVK